MANESQATNTINGLQNKTVGKRRSKVACLSCRTRKVRCDVHPHGSPCTNCRLDGTECTLRERRRKHLNPKQANREIPSNSIEIALLDPLGSVVDGQRRERLLQSPAMGVLSNLHPTTQGVKQFHESRLTESSANILGSELSRLQDLPEYVHCQLDQFSRSDICYLESKGCFSLPVKEVMDDLLKCYFNFIHPQLPMLDEQEFWETYLVNELNLPQFHHADNYKISLVLLQAILFAATTCADIGILKRAGFNSRSAARRITFSKVRVLYSLDVERDRFTLLQCLLLMSFWSGGTDNDKDGWHWSGLAASLALTLRLHEEPSGQVARRERTFRKRCWWSCVARERVVALAEGRRSRIPLHECELPMLSLADYNVGLRSKLSDLSAAEELGKRTALSLFSIEMTRLLLHLDREHQLYKVGGGISKPSEETWVRSYLETARPSSTSRIASLDHWKTNLPEVLQQFTTNEDGAVLPCILVHRNALHVYFQYVLPQLSKTRLRANDSASEIIMSVCTSPLRDSACRNEAGFYKDTVTGSLHALIGLRRELLDSDVLHCLPRECVDMLFQRNCSIAYPVVEIPAAAQDDTFFHTDISRHYRDLEFDTLSVSGPRAIEYGDLGSIRTPQCYDVPFDNTPGLSARASTARTRKLQC